MGGNQKYGHQGLTSKRTQFDLLAHKREASKQEQALALRQNQFELYKINFDFLSDEVSSLFFWIYNSLIFCRKLRTWWKRTKPFWVRTAITPRSRFSRSSSKNKTLTTSCRSWSTTRQLSNSLKQKLSKCQSVKIRSDNINNQSKIKRESSVSSLVRMDLIRIL